MGKDGGSVVAARRNRRPAGGLVKAADGRAVVQRASRSDAAARKV